MPRFFPYICQLLLLCAMQAHVYGQHPVFKNFGTKEGLPTSEIYMAAQDDKGYMWFGSDRGICRYDGYSFQTWSNSDGLPDNTVFRLLPQKDTMWFETYSGKLGYICKNKLYLYKYNDILKRFLQSSVINSVQIGAQGTLWISKTRINTYEALGLRYDGSIDSSLFNANQKVKKAYIFRNGLNILTGPLRSDTTEVCRIGEKKPVVRLYAPFIGWSQNPYSYYVNGKLFFIAGNEGYIIENGKCRHIFTTPPHSVISMYVDHDENVWVGYRNYGVHVYKAATGYQTKEELFKNLSASCIYQASDGGLWVCTLENGIYYLPPFALRAYIEEFGMAIPKIIRLHRINDKLYMHLFNSNVGIMPVNGGDIDIYKSVYDTSASDVGQTKSGRILYSGSSKGHYIKYDTRLKGVVGTIHPAQHIWQLYSDVITEYDSNGNFIHIYDLTSYSRAKCGMETANGHFLAGSLEGLYECYDGKIVVRDHDPFLRHRISAIERLDAGHLVIGTMGNGMAVVTEDGLQPIKIYTTADGLPSMMCHILYRENDSVVWLGTNKGLCRMSGLGGKHPRFMIIDVNDGLASNEVNDIAGANGKLLACTSNGLSVIPFDIKPENYELPLHIEKITVGSHTYDADTALELGHDHNALSISFTAIDYRHGDKLMYRYRLQPLDTAWSYTTNRMVIYQNLGSGRYTFELQAVNNLSHERSKIIRYGFSIKTPYWATWWFICLCVLATGTGIYTVVQQRIKFVKRQASLKTELNTFKEKALRAQMNPHFIYNSLSSIQSYILKHETTQSVSMLSKFSRLMRLTFKNTDISNVYLREDLDALALYAELENMRFSNKFDLDINIAPDIDTGAVRIPPLVIQPFVENAILHGLVNKGEAGKIQIFISRNPESIAIKICDNGIGRKRAGEIKSRKDKYQNASIITEEIRRRSGISVTRSRIEQAWTKNPEKSCFMITDLYNDDVPVGTCISFNLPLIITNL